MTLSRELTRRLKDNSEPPLKRLKLAEKTFTSESLPITQKENFVLKWLCQVAKEGNENEFVWRTLSRCLRFKNASGNVIFKSDVKQVLINTLIKKLACIEKSELTNVLDCCEMIFIDRDMRLYFRSKISSLCDLMKALFTLVSDVRKPESSENTELSDINDFLTRKCAVSAVECFVTCYKQSPNKEVFADTFVKDILYPLCRLVHKNHNDKLGAEIHKCVQQLIFGKSRYSQFKEYNGKNVNDFPSRVFAELRKKAEISDEDNTVVVFLYVFRAAVGSYKNDPAAIDAIFRCLLNCSARAEIRVFTCFHQQLTNITFDYQNKIGDLTLFEYLQRFVDKVLSTDHLDSVDYEALSAIGILNPLIIETKMSDILKRILLKKKETKNEMDAYRDLMIVIINAGVRLRREQKLIPWILKAIEETLEEESGNDDFDIDTLFPTEFTKQFTRSVGNMTSMQTIGVFRTLIFHLNKCVETSVSDDSIATYMLEANVALITAYLEGVRIFDNSVAISAQDKFVQALKNLGKTLSLLTDKVLKIHGNEKMIVSLLTVTWYWDNIYNWIRYYARDAVPEKLDFPISDVQVQQIVENIDNDGCKKAMNRILIQQMGRNLQDQTSVDLSILLDGLEKSWSIILDESPQILSLMNNSQIAELAIFLLNDVRSANVDYSMKRLSAESVQNDERFVTALVCQTLADMAARVNESTTKKITGHVNVIKILNRGKVSKVLKEINKEFMKNEWMSMNEESLSTIEKDLKVLLCLPLKHLSVDLRTLILLIVYSIKKECTENNNVFDLCTEITLDISEKSDIDIIGLIDSASLINELIHDKSVRRVIESSLKNVSSWEKCNVLIKNSRKNDGSATILFECIERIRPKLKNDAKKILKKAQHKLSKKLIDGFDEELKDHTDIKRLIVALKVSLANGEVPDNLVTVTKSTLHRLFGSETLSDEKLVAEGLKLVNVVLKHREKLELNDEVVNNIWPYVLKNPTKEIVQPLVETTEPKALSKLFNLLHTQTISGLNEANESCFASALIIWDSITSVQMGGTRQVLRTAALEYLLQTLQISRIPAEHWPGVLKFIQNTLPEKLHFIENGIDVIMLLVGRSLKETELSVCGPVLAICSSMVKFKAGIIIDRLPDFLGLYCQLVRLVVRESRKQDNDSSRERILGCLALDIEKFSNALVKQKKDLPKISAKVIVDLVEIFSEGVIPTRVKAPLEDSVGHFLSISDQHVISLLSRTLPTSTQGIFKTLYETYNKFYKYTGKI